MMPDKITILFMRWADLDNTNAQSLNAREIALRLDPRRFTCTLFYEREPDPRLLKMSNIRLVRVAPRLRTAIVLREMLRKHQIIAYINHSPASYLFLRLPGKFRSRTITVHHAEAPAGQATNVDRTTKFLSQAVMSRCDAHTAITQFVSRDLADAGIKSDFILPVGVDTRLFSPPPERKQQEPTVLFVGTLIERKGANLFVDAAQAFPMAKFLLAGSGRGGFEEGLRRRCLEQNISNVRFLGSQLQPAMVEIMQRSDIFLLPSRLEGIPKVTLEAAATGLPCIVFDDYQTPSVVDGETGFQIKTVEDMHERLRLLLHDVPLRQKLGTAAVCHARAFDWDTVARIWEEVYLQLADRVEHG